MKLVKDFGVRALLMVMLVAPVSFGIPYCIVTHDIELLKTLLAVTGGLVGSVVAFYFGRRRND